MSLPLYLYLLSNASNNYLKIEEMAYNRVSSLSSCMKSDLVYGATGVLSYSVS